MNQFDNCVSVTWGKNGLYQIDPEDAPKPTNYPYFCRIDFLFFQGLDDYNEYQSRQRVYYEFSLWLNAMFDQLKKSFPQRSYKTQVSMQQVGTGMAAICFKTLGDQVKFRLLLDV